MAETVLITGVSGYIGFRTMVLALEAGHQVRAVIRNMDQAEKLQTHQGIRAHSSQLEFFSVSDLTRSSEFDNILKDVTGVLHLASPLAVETTDYQKDIIQPAIAMTNSILEAASRSRSVKRVVITSSAVTLVPFEWLAAPTDQVFTEKDINLSANATGPFQSTMEAYWASKALARLTSKTFMETQSPKFELINILPTVVIGPDNRPTCTTTADLLTTTSGYAMMLILGQKSTTPLFGTSVHVDDVAKAHVDALSSKVPGNAEYLLTSDGLDGVVWEDGMEITRKYFGEAVESGLLPLGGEMGTMRIRIDTKQTEEALGWKCRSFEETIKGLVGQFLELKRAEYR